MSHRCLWLALCCVLALACGAESPGGGEVAVPEAEVSAEVDTSDVDAEVGPVCAYEGRHLVPGPCEEGFDEALAAKALRYDRCWRLFNAGEIGVNADLSVSAANVEDRALIEDFIRDGEGWEAEFEAFAGRPATDLITGRGKTAGLYVGAGIVADAYRYGVLRDQGYPQEEVARAREHLLISLEVLHVATAVTGVPGVIARGLALTAWNEAWHYELLPLADAEGEPLPLEKNNGTWRADNSPEGLYPQYIWEDSCSRDMLVGWAGAFGAAAEVIADDPQIPEAVKATLKQDALDLGRALMEVRESGYDLEVPDADGRITLHGWLNEHNLDGKVYAPSFENGFHAAMALGIVGAYALASGDAELQAWLQDDLIDARELPRIAKEGVALFCDMGSGTNFSNVNMAMMGYWLAQRYVADPAAREVLREGMRDSLYARPGEIFQPRDHHYSFYDFAFAASEADANAFDPATEEPDAVALANGLDTLTKFAEPPYWDLAVVNCPAYEAVACKQQYNEGGSCSWDDMDLSQPCLAVDGVTELIPAGCTGWKCTEVVSEAVPWQLQRPSNYHWRSPPHEANGGGDGSAMMPGVDFRLAYWLGRWTAL